MYAMSSFFDQQIYTLFGIIFFLQMKHHTSIILFIIREG